MPTTPLGMQPENESGAATGASSESGEVIRPEDRPGVFWPSPGMRVDPQVRGLEALSNQLDYITDLLERLVSGIHEVKNDPVENPKAPPPSEGGRSIVEEKFKQLKGQRSLDDELEPVDHGSSSGSPGAWNKPSVWDKPTTGVVVSRTKRGGSPS